MSQSNSANATSPVGRKTPVFFLSIGGPNFLEDTGHPASIKLAEIGREITTKVKPKAIIVISAHWEYEKNRVAINVAEKGQLIYDFNGFPKHYYEVQYPHRGSREVADTVIEKLSAAGIAVDRVERGLDHGIWVGFLSAFDPKTNPLNVPIVQVSMFAGEDPEQHYRMGQALEPLREEGMLIIGTGMAVHNLRDFRAMRGQNKTMPYSSTFEEAITEAVTAEPEDRHATMSALLERKDARQAHPTLDHVLPLYIAAGAAGWDAGKRLWAMPEGSINWGQYRFGDMPTDDE